MLCAKAGTTPIRSITSSKCSTAQRPRNKKGARPLPPECPESSQRRRKNATSSPSPTQTPTRIFRPPMQCSRRVSRSTVVVGPLAQQVKIDYDKLGEDHKIDGDVTLLTKFLRAGAKKRGGQRDVIAWDSTAFNYLISPDQYSCETSHWQFVACTSISKSGKPVDENDVCLTHRESDPGGWTANEYYQLWIGDLKNIPTAVLTPGAACCPEARERARRQWAVEQYCPRLPQLRRRRRKHHSRANHEVQLLIHVKSYETI